MRDPSWMEPEREGMGGVSERTKRSASAGQAPGAARWRPEAGRRQPAGFPGPVLSPSSTLARLKGFSPPASTLGVQLRAVQRLTGDPEAAAPLGLRSYL